LPGADYRCPVTPMWDCPRCGRAFANRNQSHSCAPLGDLDRHFAHASPEVRAALDRVLAAASRLGPVTVLPEKTRIAFEIHRMGEKTMSQVAAELGLSTPRTWTLIRRAYRHLRERLIAAAT